MQQVCLSRLPIAIATILTDRSAEHAVSKMAGITGCFLRSGERGVCLTERVCAACLSE